MLGAVLEGPPIKHVVYATREDKPSAGAGLVAPDVEGGVWVRHYVFREESVIRRPTEAWTAIGEDGCPLSIEGVFEDNSGARARRLRIVCERTSS